MDDLANPTGPSVLQFGHPKQVLVAQFLADYRSAFDGSADELELFTDVFTDLIHVAREALRETLDATADELDVDMETHDCLDSAWTHVLAERL